MEIIKSTTKYIPLLPSKEYTENNLCVEVGYILGGHNWYNGKVETRGYYLICTPVLLEERKLDNGQTYNTITNTVGVGGKVLLKKVTRKSKKAETEAISKASKEEKWLIEQICARYGLKLAKGSTIRFYSPIKARLEPKFGSYDDDVTADYATALDYAGVIERCIADDIRDNEDNVLGLLDYADDPLHDLFSSVVSSFSVGVEIGTNNTPLLVYTCTLQPGLLPATVKELSDAMADELEGQYSDGWGEGFEQKAISTDDGTLYVNVWESDFEFTKIEITND